jgi:hypothetical protein
MRWPAWRLGGALLAFAVLSSTRALAQAPPAAERAQVYSAYELETIGDVLSSRHLVRERKPEGKIIERIDVAPLDVFERRDPLPAWLDVFHATTHRSVISREMLLHEGERYQQTLVDETLRNLRALPQLSLVLVVATAGTAPDRIGVVIITKDVWSLRASWDIVATPGGIEELDLEPTETNLFGTHQTVRALAVYEPSAYTFGVGYTIPRLDVSRIAVLADAEVMVNRASGSPEGSYGSLTAGQPLYSGLAHWSWDAVVQWEDVVTRRYVNAQLSDYVDPTTNLLVPYQYRTDFYGAQYELTRSFGWNTKQDFTFSAGINRAVYRVPATGLNPIAVADFIRDRVPMSDTSVGPSIRYRTYTKRYLRVIDFDSLALQEDYGLGHDIVLRAAPSFRALGGSRNVVDVYAAAQYTFAIRDGLFRVSLSSDNGIEPSQISDAVVTPWAHLVTPTIGKLGRIVVDGGLEYRWRNYLKAQEIVGGDDRIRGFPTNYFVGPDMLAYSVELRSRPVEILSCQLGAVAFYDVADAFNGFSQFEPYQSTGVGFRALFPWLDRVVFRGDIGFPLKRPVDPTTGALIPPYGFIVSFGQAFSVPSVAPAQVLPTEQSEQLE